MKKFMAPTLEIQNLKASDIIATSFVNGFDGDFNEDGFGDMLSRGDLGDFEIFSE